jgi:hypothetical protein
MRGRMPCGRMPCRACESDCARARQDRNKPVLFSMARLDRVKNLTGLVEFYAKSGRLRAACNLVIVGGVVDPSQARAARMRARLAPALSAPWFGVVMGGANSAHFACRRQRRKA